MIIFHNIAQEMQIYPQYVSDGPNDDFMTECHNIPKIYDQLLHRFQFHFKIHRSHVNFEDRKKVSEISLIIQALSKHFDRINISHHIVPGNRHN